MAGKCELIAPKGDKRSDVTSGRIEDNNDVSRSLAADRRKKAKRAAKPGRRQGDRKREPELNRGRCVLGRAVLQTR
jgi:hypothetical protein